jgi:hypothetical protein
MDMSGWPAIAERQAPSPACQTDFIRQRATHDNGIACRVAGDHRLHQAIARLSNGQGGSQQDGKILWATACHHSVDRQRPDRQWQPTGKTVGYETL